MVGEDGGVDVVGDSPLSSLLSEGNYAAAFETIKSNPLAKINFDQAVLMLNHLGK